MCDNKYYTQNYGLPMGSPNSPLPVNIFISNICVHDRNSFFFFSSLYRYVDYTLLCFAGTDTQMNSLVECISKFIPNIIYFKEIK